MQVTLYIFDKKINSTKLPQPGTASSVYQVVLKDGCNMLNPVLIFTGVQNPTAYNYAYIPDFGKYYYVTNWEAYRDRWIVSLSVDVLASYRSQIGDSVQYVGRSESAYNTDIADNYYPAVGGYHMVSRSLDTIAVDDGGNPVKNPWTISQLSGSYVLQISGKASITGVTYYVCNHDGFVDFLQSLYSDSVLDNLFKQGVVQPFNYINSCKWYPIEISGIGGNLAAISFGSWTLNINLREGSYFRQLSPIPITVLQYFIASGKLPVHPQASSRGQYLKLTPYSNYILHFPPFGEIRIEPSAIYNASEIGIAVTIDNMTGLSALYVFVRETGRDTLISTVQINMAVDIPISGSTINIGNLIGGVANSTKTVSNAAAMVASTGGIAGGTAVVSAVASIGNTALAAAPIYETITTAAGSSTVYLFPPSLSLEYLLVSPENSDAGRPLMDMRKINTLTGFVQIIDPHFEIAMTDTEMNALISAANSGFFFE